MTSKHQFPALIDCHVHFREPGFEHKADLASESKAARAGGILVVCEMPNTNPPTNCIAAFQDKVQRASRCADVCDVRFYFGATKVEHLEDLRQLWSAEEHAATLKPRCSGLKLYLDNSTGDMKSDDHVTEAAFKMCAELNIPLVAHCEHSGCNEHAANQHPYTGPESHSLRRPAQSEEQSIKEAIDRAARYGTQLHIAHMSTAGGFEAVKQAKLQGMPITCEVTPHHLFLHTQDYTPLGSKVKVNPPLRVKGDRDALWMGLLNGEIDCVATDHAPHLVEEKNVTTGQPPSGIPGVELVLPLLLTVVAGKWPHPTEPLPEPLAELGKKPLLKIEDVVRMMYTNPNRIFNLGIPEQARVECDIGAEFTVDEGTLNSKCRWSPYHGWKLVGQPAVLE